MPPRGGSRGRKICTPPFLDSLVPNQPKTAKKSILARKSYGMTYHTTLAPLIDLKVCRTPSLFALLGRKVCPAEILDHSIYLYYWQKKKTTFRQDFIFAATNLAEILTMTQRVAVLSAMSFAPATAIQKFNDHFFLLAPSADTLCNITETMILHIFFELS